MIKVFEGFAYTSKRRRK